MNQQIKKDYVDEDPIAEENLSDEDIEYFSRNTPKSIASSVRPGQERASPQFKLLQREQEQF